MISSSAFSCYTFQKQPLKNFLKILQNSQENTCFGISFLEWVFSCGFCKIFTNIVFCITPPGGCLHFLGRCDHYTLNEVFYNKPVVNVNRSLVICRFVYILYRNLLRKTSFLLQWANSQLTFTSSKSTMETPEQCVKSVQI